METTSNMLASGYSIIKKGGDVVCDNLNIALVVNPMIDEIMLSVDKHHHGKYLLDSDVLSNYLELFQSRLEEKVIAETLKVIATMYEESLKNNSNDDILNAKDFIAKANSVIKEKRMSLLQTVNTKDELIVSAENKAKSMIDEIMPLIDSHAKRLINPDLLSNYLDLFQLRIEKKVIILTLKKVSIEFEQAIN